MASPPKQPQLLECAAAEKPQCANIPNNENINEEQVEFEDSDDVDEYEEGAGSEDLFDDELNDQDWTGDGGGGDFTKQYNRQRVVVEKGVAPAAVKSNAQKPRANLAARVDDQISSLAKFAARIKLGDTEAGMTGKGERCAGCSHQL